MGGYVTIDELKAALLALGFAVADDGLDLVFKLIDVDGSGDISVKELDKALKKVDRHKKKERVTPRDLIDTDPSVESFGVDQDDMSLPEMLGFLSRQQRRHRAEQRGEVRTRESTVWTKSAIARARFKPVDKVVTICKHYKNPDVGVEWKRPSERSDEFSFTGRLPACYLSPLEASRVDRPTRCYVPHPGPPFRYTKTYPEVLGEPEAMNGMRNMPPLFLGDSVDGSGPEFEMTPRPLSYRERPRPLKAPVRHSVLLAGVEISTAAPTWNQAPKSAR